MTTINDVDYTGWSPPGPADLPQDELQAQLEVYSETVLLRGFEGDTNWVLVRQPRGAADRAAAADRTRAAAAGWRPRA